MQLIPLGAVTPGATFATVSVPLLSAAFLASLPTGAGASRADVNVAAIQAGPLNGGPIYICTSAAAPDTTNYTNILYVIGNGGDSWPLVGRANNDLEAGKLFIGAGNATDFVFGYVRRA